MEQIVLYLAVLAALAGFGMGLMNLVGPYLKRRKITLPRIDLAALLNRGRGESDDDDLDFDDEDEDDLDTARDFAEKSFVADVSLLARRRSIIDEEEEEEEEEELDEELASVLDQVAQEEFETDEDEDEDNDEERTFYTVSVEAAESGAESLDDDLNASQEEDGEDDEEYEDDEDDEESAKPEVQTVAAASGDMLSFFNESADDVAKVHLAWRDDIPEVSIDELLAEARAISQQIKNKKHHAA